MLLTSQEMACRLEEVDTIHITRQIEACAQIFPDNKCVAVTITNGGVAAITVPSFGRKLNRIVGYGTNGPVPETELVVIEDLFAKHGLNTEIHLCPLTDLSALSVLTTRGYVVDGFLNAYVRVLTDEDLNPRATEGVTVSRMASSEADNFPALSKAGYLDGGRAPLLLETFARIAVMREDTTLYAATIDGKVAGTAAMAIIETKRGFVAHMYVDSTLPEYRGRGVQLALLRARLADAKKRGVEVASVAARPSSGSCRNIERVEFSLAYTKVWCVKARKK